MTAKSALGLAMLVASAVAACVVEGGPSSTPDTQLSVSASDDPEMRVEGDSGLQLYVRNETDREVVIVIDGVELLRVAAGQRVAGRQVIVPAREAYTVAARTTAGRELGSFRTDTEAWLGAPGFVKNLRCGDIWVWVGHDVAVGMIAPFPQELQEPCD